MLAEKLKAFEKEWGFARAETAKRLENRLPEQNVVIIPKLEIRPWTTLPEPVQRYETIERIDAIV